MLSSATSYIKATKPKSVLLLVFTTVGAMIVAGRDIPLNLWIRALVTITAGCAGANVLNSYIDRDIDAMMERTKRRPLPQGSINPPEKALGWGFFLMAISLTLSWAINPLSFVWIAAGLFDDIVIYSLLAKRKTSWNIVLGAASGGLPVLFGWSAVTGHVSLIAILMSLLVILWIPNHIWNLAIRYKEDYSKAEVPMLPVVYDIQKTIFLITATVVLTFGLSLVLYLAAGFGLLYLIISLCFGLAILLGHLYLLTQPTPQNAWLMFKLSSPYLFLVFLGMILDRCQPS